LPAALSEKQIVDILRLFERFDDNGNGIIDKRTAANTRLRTESTIT